MAKCYNCRRNYACNHRNNLTCMAFESSDIYKFIERLQSYWTLCQACELFEKRYDSIMEMTIVGCNLKYNGYTTSPASIVDGCLFFEPKNEIRNENDKFVKLCETAIIKNEMLYHLNIYINMVSKNRIKELLQNIESTNVNFTILNNLVKITNNKIEILL